MPESAEDSNRCQQCGGGDAHPAGEELLCAACLHARGSCGGSAEDDCG